MKWITENWFELITAFIAVAAFVQPWITKWIQSKNNFIEILPNKNLDIGFNKRGLYIISYAAFVSKHTDAILSLTRSKILKEKNCLYNLESDIFLNPFAQYYSSGGQSIDFSSATFAYQIYLVKGKPELLRIQFNDYEVEKKTSKYLNENNRDNLLLQCKFEPGEYEFIFELTDAHNKVYLSKYMATFTDLNVKLLQECIDKILKGETHNQFVLPIRKI